MSTSENSNLEKLYFSDRQEWRNWLAENYNKSKGIWFIFYKKHTNQPTLSYDEAVEEALCFGWIDSLANKLDNERHLLLMTPRKPKSPWSRLNKTRIKKLMKENLMHISGLEKIEIAKKDGSWSVYDDIENLVIPEDLQRELKKIPIAQENFDKFSSSNKKGILWWLKTAKRDATRLSRIKKIVDNMKVNKNPLA